MFVTFLNKNEFKKKKIQKEILIIKQKLIILNNQSNYLHAKYKQFYKEYVHTQSTRCFDFNMNHTVYVNNELKQFFEYKSLQWKNFNNNLIDTHCHFDMLFKK